MYDVLITHPSVLSASTAEPLESYSGQIERLELLGAPGALSYEIEQQLKELIG
jgi:hypothetical protein